MQESGIGFIDTLLVWGGVASAWVMGEGGRVAVASGLGGLTRWLSAERRRIRDGVLSVLGGFVVGKYMWPAVLAVLQLSPTPDHIAMSAFIAGTLGVSFVKILTAVVEARTRGWSGGPNA